MEVFTEISIIIAVAAGVSIVMRILRQPLIIGYIITGLIVGPYLLNIVSTGGIIQTFSQIGIAFLLFIVGLELSPRAIREVGWVSLLTGLGQIIFTSLVGFGIGIWLGFSQIEAAYIGIALTFSSTIVVLKILSDKGDTKTLYGRVAIGAMLVQDIVAAILLIFIASFSSGSKAISLAVELLIKASLTVGVLILISAYILPRISRFIGGSQEFLFLFSIAWGLGIGSLMHFVGLSVEVGALIAGVALSMSPYNVEISAKMHPLRDFFLVLFFVFLGSQLSFGALGPLLKPAAIFSLFILIGNPFIFIVLMGLQGYRSRTSFMAGVTMAQISEFSFILVILGVTIGHISESILSLVTIVGLITIAGSTYMIIYADRIFRYKPVKKFLSEFEWGRKRDKRITTSHFDIILLGYNEMGFDLVKSFSRLGRKFLVVDFDPRVVHHLTEAGIANQFGDARNPEFLAELSLKTARMVISVIPDLETNLLIIDQAKKARKSSIVIVIANNFEDTKKLYKAGASYVLMPHILGGHHAAKMIFDSDLRASDFVRDRKKHLKYIEKRSTIEL
ncbi:MAG: sodium:proton exchanger [Candidatus Yanofskybacteria bacterium CG10_big_fil_rev_8_21_14_0_10_46_23]|uniref:Sodium:proton exchanger n=1 Tax=Candidatus Yanofskybacteria bacterium CG10_big_fil_rev_8_21_14_0_10_46_23 TaxID=1975098 RepID=A0A2H0R4T6_9BACT|nr:MAG: sodium:proton exchanger [Candidatus Yanofskybacteria bacterium CG10_big_fil_rev_8_21_14_0_10_46_23]